ncbi:MAG TPA: amidase [Gemmatimonadales bacterium]|jgi:Asp-tRNA(Asn)/Glu-tRNA(Gln) amidotransferase A subunit family amidase
MSFSLDRRSFVAACTAAGLPLDLSHQLWATDRAVDGNGSRRADPVTKEQIAAAEAVLGLSFRDSDRDLMLRSVNQALATYTRLHAIPLSNAVPPAFHFDPVPLGKSVVPQPATRAARPVAHATAIKAPQTEADWAFASVTDLGKLIRARKVTSRQLVERSLARIDRYNSELLAVITPTPERALAQADALDAEARAGKFRGPLHGIPYGAKDLYAVPKYPTTWGSPLYKDQVLDVTAAVVERLDAAGAVLVAKTSLGEFAQDDVWFGGQTKNPWNTTVGSSGSSAGSASGVSAGLYPFALGTETLGSIVAPSTRCGVSGLRPTYGRVSRYGAMALSWTMDKAGPIARSAADLALVFAALHGADPRDPSTRTVHFAFEPARPLAGIRIGVLDSMTRASNRPNSAATVANNQKVLDALVKQGAKLVTVTWPVDPSANTMQFLLDVEAGAAFDAITRDNEVDKMVLQTANAWPTTFRAAHLISAVDYVQANRARTLLISRLDEFFRDVDVVVAPGTGGNTLAATNLSGHPQACVPVSVSDTGTWQSVSFIAALYREDLALRLAHAWQMASDAHTKRPPKFS